MDYFYSLGKFVVGGLGIVYASSQLVSVNKSEDQAEDDQQNKRTVTENFVNFVSSIGRWMFRSSTAKDACEKTTSRESAQFAAAKLTELRKAIDDLQDHQIELNAKEQVRKDKAILGIDKFKTHLSLNEISAAFRTMALKTHPDKKGGHKDSFVMLDDAKKRLEQIIESELCYNGQSIEEIKTEVERKEMIVEQYENDIKFKLKHQNLENLLSQQENHINEQDDKLDDIAEEIEKVESMTQYLQEQINCLKNLVNSDGNDLSSHDLSVFSNIPKDHHRTWKDAGDDILDLDKSSSEVRTASTDSQT